MHAWRRQINVHYSSPPKRSEAENTQRSGSPKSPKNKNRGAQKYANIIASKISFLRHNG